MRNLIAFAATLVVCLLEARVSLGADCDYTISVGETSVDGDVLGVQPGETICIEAGERPFLRFYNIVGKQDAPIVIQNSGGVVLLDNADRGYGLTAEGSAFFRITGTGSEDEFGFSIRASRQGPDYSASCVVVSGLSTDYELDHLEIHECGFAGMNIKTEPTCDLSANLGNFVQKNTRVHHNRIFDTHGEGIYFGSTGYGGREYTCDGIKTTLYPHTHEGVWIHNNHIFDTGWDGLQVGVSPKDCFVYQNTIERVGLLMEQYQMQGIQVGGASRCTVVQNFLAHGPAAGIFALDNQDTLIENNVIVDFVDGIYVNDRDNEESQGAAYIIAHNTVVESGDRGVTLYGPRSRGDQVLNNLIVGTVGQALGVGADVDATSEGNLVLDQVADADFVDAAAGDFQLKMTSVAVDSGYVSSEYTSAVDFLGAVRDNKPDVGAFEFGAEPSEPLQPLWPGGGSDESFGMAGGPSTPESNGEKSGCSCRHAGTSTPTPGSAVAIFACLLSHAYFRRIKRKSLAQN